MRVPFQGDIIDATQDGRGVWVSLKRMCENLGIDPDSQRKKLQNKPWAVTVLNTATGPDGKNYEMLTLHLDSVPMWLATIESSRVAPEIREKLVAYQKECARVLRDHFFGASRETEQTVAILKEMVVTLSNQVKALMDMQQANAFQAACEQSNGTIGEQNARSYILRPLMDIASIRALFSKDRKRVASERKKADIRLRGVLRVPINVCWKNLPDTMLGDICHQVALLRKDAEAIAKQGWVIDVSVRKASAAEQLSLQMARLRKAL